MNHGEVRRQAALAAYKTLRHLLHADTVHLLSVADIAEAVTAASDILAPAEQQALNHRAVLLHDVEQLRRDLERARRENLQLAGQRDSALQAADRLAYAVAALSGTDIGRHASDNNPWRRAMDILDAIADANDRPRPSQARLEVG